jgi:SAM-dependent methyltransferase
MSPPIPSSRARSILKKFLPRSFRLWFREVRNERRVNKSPGRIVLVTQILPAYAACAGRILWVGCRRYTRNYASLLEQNGGECWTADIEISHAQWGQPGRHFTWDLVAIDTLIAGAAFDTVLCNGIFGWGIDTRAAQLAALMAMGRILKPGGRLLLGWNTDRVEDPLTFDFVQNCFVPDASITGSARRAVPAAGYVFDFLRRTENQA